MDTTTSLLHSFKRFFSGTMLSRASGLFREVTMAFVFGVTPQVAAFWVAFRFANLFRRLFGEGGLNLAFIPHYESLKKQNGASALSFFLYLSKKLVIFLLPLVLLIEGGLFFFKEHETVRLTMIMLPSLLFLSLYTLNSAFLNTEKSYFLPSAAPTVVNIIWIISALLIQLWGLEHGIEYLAYSVIIANVGQWLLTYIPVRKLTKNVLKEKHLLKPFLKPFLLTLIGVTAQQINSAIDALFAQGADPSAPATLWYAIRLQQLPFALIGVGLMNALLPPLSRAKEEKTYFELLTFSLKKIATFLIPLTFLIIIGAFSGVNLLYGRGAFLEKDTFETALCLIAYAIALLPMGWTLLLASAFYAKKEVKIPMIASLLSILCNILLNAFFIYVLHMKAVSIALATTLSSFVNLMLLVYFLKARLGLIKMAFKIAAFSGAIALFTSMCAAFFLKDNTLPFFLQTPLHPFVRSLPLQILHCCSIGGVFLGILLLFNVGGIRSRTPAEY